MKTKPKNLFKHSERFIREKIRVDVVEKAETVLMPIYLIIYIILLILCL